jgi:hypothetical protein
MKSVSARVLMLIASRNNYKVLTGDIKNAYLYAKNKLKVYVRLGKEFNVYDENIKVGQLAIVEQNLYGIATASSQWHAHLSDTLLTMGFRPTRFDPDVWMRRGAKGEGYDYIGTHTDDLLVVAKKPEEILTELQKKYTINGIGEPSFHLGCDYKQDANGHWYIGTETYVKESLKKVCDILGKPSLGHEGTPMNEKCKPELDNSDFLDLKGHRKYQQLIGIAQWLVTCGRMDLAFALNSLSRFSAAPRVNHLKWAERMFCYLNKHPAKWVRMDPGEHIPSAELEDPVKDLEVDWKQQYPDAHEMKEHDMMDNFPINNGLKPMTTMVYFDSNFAHDEVTRRSITGIVGYVGNTPVTYFSKRQGAVATSTYSAEICAAKVGTEEAISLRYMLRSFGVPVKQRTTLIGDNLGSLISVTKPGSPLKKKTCSVAYHFVRECNVREIVKVMKVNTHHNLADAFTKALPKSSFRAIYDVLFAKVADVKWLSN